jgi:hypothetical protein
MKDPSLPHPADTRTHGAPSPRRIESCQSITCFMCVILSSHTFFWLNFCPEGALYSIVKARRAGPLEGLRAISNCISRRSPFFWLSVGFTTFGFEVAQCRTSTGHLRLVVLDPSWLLGLPTEPKLSLGSTERCHSGGRARHNFLARCGGVWRYASVLAYLRASRLAFCRFVSPAGAWRTCFCFVSVYEQLAEFAYKRRTFQRTYLYRIAQVSSFANVLYPFVSLARIHGAANTFSGPFTFSCLRAA